MSASQLPTARRSATADTRASTRGPGTGAVGPPLVMERYRVLRRLGAGAFGTVWMARDERLDREVAVKILPRERIVGGRFEREARAAARLSHPAIVTLYEAAVDDEGAYLVSELVRGPTLLALLEDGRLSDRDIVAIAISLCEGLSHAHAEGVVHRDVKPSNILVPDRPTSLSHPAKLTDFGVARLVGGDSLTRTGDVIGTAAYMAPEQAEGRQAGAPADLYALALVTYEALTGINPVRTNTAAVQARRLGAHLPPLRRHRRDLPRDLGRGIDLALRPRPRERGTLEELQASFTAALESLDDTPGVVASPWPRKLGSRTERGSEEGFDADPFGLVDRDPDGDQRARRSARLDPRDRPDQQPLAEPGAHSTRRRQRALAALAAALVAGWFTGHALPPSALPAPLAALGAAILTLLLPRLGWIATGGALMGAALIQQRPGAALVLLLAMLPTIALMPWAPTQWPLPAGAPALGIIGLAGAWPAVAAQLSRSAWRRAVLGLSGWVWLTLAAPLAGTDLYAARPPGAPSPDVWTASLPVTVHDVLGPIISSGALVVAPVWAAGAVLLPWILHRSSLTMNIVAVTAWSATIAAATEAAITAGRGAAPAVSPRTAVIGAVAGGVVALLPSLTRAWRTARRDQGLQPELP